MEVKAPFRLRPYARAMFKRRDLRMFACLWRRQGGKTTTLATRALWEMAAHPGRLIIFASASLLVGREVIEKEAQIFRDVLRNFSESQKEAGLSVLNDAGKDCTDCDDANFAELFESQRMSVRLKHPDGSVSRTQVIAPNPATARGFTGTTFIDEFGWIRDFRDVWDAMEPIFSSDPTFNCILATTPPADDTHYSHELIVPPPGLELAANAEGNWYESMAGITVHRVDVHDAALAGVKLYDRKSRKEITPEEHRLQSLDRESWARNYLLSLSASGTAACSRLALDRAQSHVESANCIAVDDGEVPPSGWLQRLFPQGQISSRTVGLGMDVATTANEKSNYSSFTVGEMVGTTFAARLVWRWKEKDPKIVMERVRALVTSLCQWFGHSPVGFCIDASSEVYFANLLKDAVSHLVNVQLVSNGETLFIGSQKYNYKQYLGDSYTNALEEGRVVLPASRWLFEDHRLVRKENGKYEAAVANDGCHADSFDGNKLAYFSLSRAESPGEILAFAPEFGSCAQMRNERSVLC